MERRQPDRENSRRAVCSLLTAFFDQVVDDVRRVWDAGCGLHRLRVQA